MLRSQRSGERHDDRSAIVGIRGIVLVAALVVLISSIHAVAREGQRALTGAALVFTAAFASLIFFNYVVQTTFVPVLAARVNVRA